MKDEDARIFYCACRCNCRVTVSDARDYCALCKEGKHDYRPKSDE